MLIQALCDYYDDLLANPSEDIVLPAPEGYSRQAIHYLISLTPEGKVHSIKDVRIESLVKDKKGKEQIRRDPRIMIFPLRSQKPGIDANFIEHRPLYIFGLNYEKTGFTPDDPTGKARKSHEMFVQKNLEWTEGLDSPLVRAYRLFLQQWVPENETENPHLLSLGKEYTGSYFAFILNGEEQHLLQEDSLLKERYESLRSAAVPSDGYIAPCAVSGKKLPISRTHDKIKGIIGGQASGTVLVGLKYDAFWSYGVEQSYNSYISEEAMRKYTAAMNLLLSDKNHRMVIDETTIFYWAANTRKNEECCSMFDQCFNGSLDPDKMNEKQTDTMLRDTFDLARKGKVTRERIADLTGVEDDAEFFIVGIKPNAARLSLKFIYRRRFADILFSLAQHQEDMYMIGSKGPVPVWMLKTMLMPYRGSGGQKAEGDSSKSSGQNIDPSFVSAVMQSILYGRPYPQMMLSLLVSRCKTDRKINSVRAGALKAYLNRQSRANQQKEECTVALDIHNTNQAYLCGRLFAVLQRIQEQAASGKLNRTIKDAYFASAASKPSLVFPKLLSLSQNHQKKLDEMKQVYFSKLLEEIISKLDGSFPDTLMLSEQGKFMIGYYHQDQDFYTKKTKEDKNNAEEPV